MTRTIESIHETASLNEAITRAMRPVAVESQTDEGVWIERTFANEGAAQEFERASARRGVATRRME